MRKPKQKAKIVIDKKATHYGSEHTKGVNIVFYCEDKFNV